MKRTHVILCLAMALTLAIAGTAQSAMWIGAQVGANFAASTDVDINIGGAVNLGFKNARVEPAVIAGLTLGYDFVREGFLGANYPDWMKYFSFATDFTFNRFDTRQQSLDFSINGVNVGKNTLPRNEGAMAVWTFLFIGKYGFFPDSEVPFGRLVPYIGVGPAIVFSSLNTAVLDQSASSVDVALVVESGIRFMALKNVSIDAAFRYRWAQPTYSYASGGGTNINVSVDANQFSAIARASYHF